MDTELTKADKKVFQAIGEAVVMLLSVAIIGGIAFAIYHGASVTHWSAIRAGQNEAAIEEMQNQLDLLNDYVFLLHPVAGDCVFEYGREQVDYDRCFGDLAQFYELIPCVPYRPRRNGTQ